MKISLLHPSRQRPERSYAVISKWIAFSGIPNEDIELIVSLDTDDPLLDHYRSLYNKTIINPNNSAVQAINNAAKYATGDIMIVVSDDTNCPEDWGKQILGAVEGKKDFILKVYDGIQKWIITMPVMDRAYYDRFGYIYHPNFKHMFCDTWLTHQAEILGKVITRNDILFEHMHPCVKKSVADEINKRADATFREGQRIYLDLCRANKFRKPNFGIDNPNARGHIEWLRRNLRY